jgi:tetratricopeptide (TPR) repeat protein
MMHLPSRNRDCEQRSIPLLSGFGRGVGAVALAFLLGGSISAQMGGNQNQNQNGSAAGPPAPRYSVIGTVQQETNNAEMRGVLVTLFAPSGEELNSAYTDSRGYFEFGNLNQGMYVITINVEGYEPYRENVMVFQRPGGRVYARLRIAAKEAKPAAPGNAVSARELALPQKTQETLHKGLDALFEIRDPAKSITYFDQVIHDAPGYYEAYYDEGVAYLRMRKMEEAETAFRKAIDLSKEHFADPYVEMASIYADEGKFTEAETMARKGLGIQPDSWRAYYELARILFGEGLPVDAEQSALEARRLEPKFPRLYIVLANIQLRLGRNQAVIEDLDAYLKLAPDGTYSAQAKELKERTEKSLGRTAPPPPPGN